MRLQVASQSEGFDPLTEGNALRRAIRVADLTQDEVATAAGIDAGFLSRLLRGRRPLTEAMAARIRATITDLSKDVA